MKPKIYALMGALLVTLSCSKDEPLEKATIVPVSVEFVNLNGSEIRFSDCVRENFDYAVKFSVEKIGTGEVEPNTVNLNVNGRTFSVNLQSIGERIIPVTLIEGGNRIEVDNSRISDFVFLSLPQLSNVFELVE